MVLGDKYCHSANQIYELTACLCSDKRSDVILILKVIFALLESKVLAETHLGWGIHTLVFQAFKGFGKYDIEYMGPNWLT